jgi:hypothetical protein
MRDVAVYEGSGVIEFPQFLGSRGRIDLVYGVYGLTRGQMVYGRSNAADARHYARDLLYGHALHEFLEAAKFRHLEIAVGYTAVVVQEDVNLPVALQTRNGVN